MKLNRLLIASLLGFSLLTTSALACDKGGSSHESHWSFFGWCHHDDNSGGHDCDDHDGGSGSDCNRHDAKGNDGSGCSTGGSGSSSSGSGSSSSGSGNSGSLPGKGIS
jgi:hypothetical protein